MGRIFGSARTCYVRNNDGDTLAEVFPPGEEEVATLFVLAPELLDALREVEVILRPLVEAGCTNDRTAAAWRTCRDLLAKAKAGRGGGQGAGEESEEGMSVESVGTEERRKVRAMLADQLTTVIKRAQAAGELELAGALNAVGLALALVREGEAYAALLPLVESCGQAVVNDTVRPMFNADADERR